MEHINLVQDPQNPVPPQQPPLPPPSHTAESKKRALEIDMQENTYFKMRSVLNEMRPQVLEVLRTPDFQNCNAAQELREKLNVLMELYKQMTEETVFRSITKPKIARVSHTFSGENMGLDKSPRSSFRMESSKLERWTIGRILLEDQLLAGILSHFLEMSPSTMEEQRNHFVLHK